MMNELAIIFATARVIAAVALGIAFVTAVALAFTAGPARPAAHETKSEELRKAA